MASDHINWWWDLQGWERVELKARYYPTIHPVYALQPSEIEHIYRSEVLNKQNTQ